MIQSKFKVQCSTNPAILTDTLNKMGFTVDINTVSDYYFCKGKTAYSVNADIYAELACTEYNLEGLLRLSNLSSQVKLPKGTIMVAESARKSLLFVLIQEIEDGTYLGFGENEQGVIGIDLYRYYKNRSRLASPSEMDTMVLLLEQLSYRVELDKNGCVNTDYLRWIGKEYYSIQIVFDKREFQVVRHIDSFTPEDNSRFSANNMFPSEEEALKVVAQFKADDKNL